MSADGQSAVLFPGQGAQAPGMGLDLAAAEPSARAVFERARDVLGHDLRDVIGGGDKAALDRTDLCQPAILVTSLAVMAALEARGKLDRRSVTACAGLSLGEYSALTWAGALDLDAAVALVQLRGRAMQAASDVTPSGMLSLIGADAATANALCDGARGGDVLVVANHLAPGQVAIAGAAPALSRALGLLKAHGIRKAVPLAVAGAFHSPLMGPAADALAGALARVVIRSPRIPVLMNVTGREASDPQEIRELLARQVTSPVLWEPSLRALIDRGVRTFLEPAPGRQLSNLLKRFDAPCEAVTVGDLPEFQALASWPSRSLHGAQA